MKKIKALLVICGCVALLALLTAFVYYTCGYNLWMGERIETFYADAHLIGAVISEPGGCAHLMALWLMQWFATPMVASLITSALLFVIALLCVRVISRIGHSQWLWPLSIVPVMALVSVHVNIDYRMTGTVAIALALMCLDTSVRVSNVWMSQIAALVFGVMLVYVAGSVAMLYGVLVVICMIVLYGYRGIASVVCPLTIWFMSWLMVNRGLVGDIRHAFWPDAYYTHWHTMQGTELLPWLTLVGVVAISVVARWVKVSNIKIRMILTVLAAVPGLYMAFGQIMHRESDTYQRMLYLVDQRDWSGVVAEMRDVTADEAAQDPTLMNMLNMALAEKDMLGDVMFRYPNAGVAALHNSETKRPYDYMILSDVYYSMGLVALSQRFAFESNEAMGNLSPRMLQRLVDTNLICGQYAVAQKYIDYLKKTVRYADWASERQALIKGGDKAFAAHPELGAKRKCLFKDNRFAGQYGINNDMVQVLHANPGHKTTMQYLGAYYLLSRNVPAFIDVINEFYGTPAVRIPLPEHFQEAMAVDAIVKGEGIDTKYQIHPSVMQRCMAFWSQHQPQPNTFWHYLRSKQSSTGN